MMEDETAMTATCEDDWCGEQGVWWWQWWKDEHLRHHHYQEMTTMLWASLSRQCLWQKQHNNQPWWWWREECGRTCDNMGRQWRRQWWRQLTARRAGRIWCCCWRRRPSKEIRHVERRLCAKSSACDSQMLLQASLPQTSFKSTNGHPSSPGSVAQVAQ